MAAASPAKAVKGGGNVLTKKFGPLPGWAWAGLGVLGFYIYKQRKASEASTAAATTATPAADLPTSDATAPSGYAYQGPGVGSGGSGAVPVGAMAHTGHHHSGVSTPTGTTTGTTTPTTSPQQFYSQGPTGTTVTTNPTALAAPGQDNSPSSQIAASTQVPYTEQTPSGPVQTQETQWGAPTLSNQAIANQGLLESLGYTPAQVAAMEAA
jgi:hypothetical protein